MQVLLICVPLYTIATFLLGASITAGIFIFHVAVVPLIFKYSKSFQRNMIFANFAQWPFHIDYETPSASGIEGARNITIEYHSKTDNCPIKIGIWHILPKTSYEKLKGSFEDNSDKELLSKQLDEELAKSKLPVVLYCHGNSNSRAASHRIELYKFFQQMDFHTIAFDYRGYGDSTNIDPTEKGVVEDSLVVYDWLNNTIDNGPDRPAVFVWGHSLGTGISSHLVGNLEHLSRTILDRSQPLPQPNGLILEAPFDNLANAVYHYPLTALLRWLPYFDNTIVSPFRSNEVYCFTSDKHLAKVKELPVLILHAKDDAIVPFVIGFKLYQSVLESRNNDGSKIKLRAYETRDGLGHKYICHAKDLPQVIGAILLTGASLTASVLFMQVAVLPLMFRYSKTVQRKMVFSNCINYPKNLDFDNPASCNVMGGRNFSIEFESKVDNCPIKLGIWHLVPCSVLRELISSCDENTLCDRLHNELQNTKNTIVLYCHGNSNHRASPHRLQMYKVFQDLNFHVIAFDYRGYGDSTRVRPTERGVVEDAFNVYSWLLGVVEAKRPLVVLWGHSLGTAIASNLVANLEELCKTSHYKSMPTPDAIVLEAPFNNLLDEIEKHPFSKLVSWLPYYRSSFVKPFSTSSEYSFTTDEYLARVTGLPVLMLHSKGDRIVPYKLAVKLYDCVAQSRSEGGATLQFHAFDRGHNDLCEARELPQIVRNFLNIIKK